MASARAEFEQKSGLFIQQLSSVNSEMGTLQASWQGTASLNFNAAMDNWEQGFQRVINALNGMIGSMGGNAAMYAGQEDAASQIANSFGNALGDGAVQDTSVRAPAAGLPGMS
jgi:WXG100 family type VII secretion target